jgi:long-chain acyl-CoA synthetase
MSEKPWLKSYPSGTPVEIDDHAYASLPEFFERNARRYAELPAFANMGTRLSFAEADEKSRYLANYLQHELNLKKGERVAIMLPNLLQNPLAILAVLRAGLVVVNTNPLYTPRELEHQLKDSGAAAIIILENFGHVLAAILSKIQLKAVIVTAAGDLLPFPKSLLVNWVVRHVKKKVPPFRIPDMVPFNRALAAGRRHVFAPPPMEAEDTAFLQYTGGTTGVAKGAMLSHRNLIANTLQSVNWISHTAPEKRKLIAGQEIVITALPLYHIFALTVNLFCFIELGGLIYLITNPRDLKGFVKELTSTRFTVITGVNTLFKGLLHTPGFDKIDFSSLKLTLGGGMAVQEGVAKRWREVTGCPLVEGYGLTEASPVVTVNPATLAGFNGSIGLPLASTECSIQDEEGRPLPTGEIGELCVKGPQVMQGYWRRPEETAQVFTPDGWLKTGDIARMDDNGFIYIVDRKKDMILVSGFNVYPNEIEAVLAEHPAIAECAAISVPDEKTGEAVKVFIVKQDESLDRHAVLQHCRMNLTSYKVPKYVEFRESLPKTNVGKILRRELREDKKAEA